MKKLLLILLAVCLALAACTANNPTAASPTVSYPTQHPTILEKDYNIAKSGNAAFYYAFSGTIDDTSGWIQIPDVLFDTFADGSFADESGLTEPTLKTKPSAEQQKSATITKTVWLFRGKNSGYSFALVVSIDDLPYADEGAWKVQVMESPGLDAKWLRVVNYVPPGK